MILPSGHRHRNVAAGLIDGLTEFRVRQMCISGQLPCFMAGRKYLIYEENLYKVVLGTDVSENRLAENTFIFCLRYNTNRCLAEIITII